VARSRNIGPKHGYGLMKPAPHSSVRLYQSRGRMRCSTVTCSSRCLACEYAGMSSGFSSTARPYHHFGCSRLRCAQGLTTTSLGGARRRPLHGGAPDAADGPEGHRSWQIDQNHGQQSGGTLPARPGWTTIQGATAEHAVALPSGWASSTSSSLSTLSPGASSAGACRDRHEPSSCLMLSSRPFWTGDLSKRRQTTRRRKRQMQ
jgi:hypothetical protein